MNCGGQVPAGARFCAGCGVAVDTEATRLAPPTRASQSSPAFLQPQQQPSRVERRTPPAPLHQQSELGRDFEDEEKVVFVVRPTLLFVGLGYAAAALGAVLLVVLLSFLLPSVSPLVSIPLALALLLIPAFYHVQRNRVQYSLTDSKIVIDRGFISRSTSNIPLRNIQNVTVTATIMQRLLRFGDVVIDDASEQASRVVLDNIPDPRRHADLILRQLRKVR